MDNLLLTITFENGFQEIYLPSVDNKTIPIEIRPYISGLKEDIMLPLEVWSGEWSIKKSKQFNITIDEEEVESTVLTPGILLNCFIKNTDIVFSLTVSLADTGNVTFNKYFLDLNSIKSLTIGNASSNIISYANKFCSPSHAEIVIEDGETVIRDKQSVNGTFLNGRLLRGSKKLSYGDIIYIVGLKLVYLGNIITINSPNDNVKVNEKSLKIINIEATPYSENNEDYRSEENYFLRTPRKIETVNKDSITIERAPTKSTQKQQPLFLTLGPSFTMVIPMLAGTMLSGNSGSFASTIAMSLGAAAIGGGWAVLNIKYNKEEAANNEQTRNDTYTNYLNKMTGVLAQKMEYNKIVLNNMLPSSEEVIKFVDKSPRLWEKSGVHNDFLHINLGNTDIKSLNNIDIPKEQAMATYDPLNDNLEKIKERMSTLKDVPSELSLYDNTMIGVVSKDREKTLNLIRVISLQLTGLHPYTELRTSYIYPMSETDSWDYTRYLPHVWAPDGSIRLIANDKKTVGDVLFFLSTVVRDRLENAGKQKDEKDKILPHYVVVIGDISLIENEPMAKYLLNPTKELGITVIFPVSSTDKLPAGCSVVVSDDEEYKGFYSTTGKFAEREKVDFPTITVDEMSRYSRNLSNFKVREMNLSAGIPEMLTFLDMYKTSKVEDLEVLKKWLENRTYESMKAMVGYKSGAEPLYLDIHEKYHGPHGLVAGTTGSGKSETLQSYILSLAVSYHPHEVAFILIDYKGGGMAQSFNGLPHLAGVITNLGGNATNRALLSINAEIKHRQRVFNEYKVKHIDAYIELYRSGVATEPMPHLLIIADEFAELKKEQPEFVRALVSAARVGRSLGVNLILATQKPSGVVDEEIWSNTRFRLCLRVADKQDSNEMLKRPEAAFITGTGRGYFQVGNDEIFDEFQSGWSGAEYTPDIPFTDDKNSKIRLINLIGKDGVPKKKKKKKSDNIVKVTQLDAIVSHLNQVACDNEVSALRQIWLDPLPKTLYLEDLKGMKKPEGFSLQLPVGLVDSPETQSQFPVAVDFLQDGHLLVCGSGTSGKTTLLQTLIYSAVTGYDKSKVNIYIADFSSRTMPVFANLPQVGGVMFEGEDEKIEEIFALLKNTLAQRKNAFSNVGIGSYRDYVQQYDDCPAILFFIDNYIAFIDSYPQYEDVLTALSREAASYGIYLVLTMNNSGDIRSRMRQNFTNGIALQMSDRYEYEAVLGSRSEILPEDRTPGRGLIEAPVPLEFQVALAVKEEAGQSTVQTLRKIFADQKPESGIKKIGAVIDDVSHESLMEYDEVKKLKDFEIALGVNSDTGDIVSLDTDKAFCYTIGGFSDTGKTDLTISLIKQLKNKGAKLYLFDKENSPLMLDNTFERVCTCDEELFSLMQEVFVPEFINRNKEVAAARKEDKDLRNTLKKEERLVLIIGDMNLFMSCVYSENYNMSQFLETALSKGLDHKINLIGIVLPDDYYDNARFNLMNTWVSYNTGIHLGGMFDQQGALDFEMSITDSVRQLPKGKGYVNGNNGEALKVLTPITPTKD